MPAKFFRNMNGVLVLTKRQTDGLARRPSGLFRAGSTQIGACWKGSMLPLAKRPRAVFKAAAMRYFRQAPRMAIGQGIGIRRGG